MSVITRKPLILYHGPGCLDGMASAWAAWKHFGDNAEYVVGKYQEDMGDIFSNRDVYLVDFSFKRAVMEDILKVANKVTLLDHHKSALEDLKGLQDQYTNFWMQHSRVENSGAMITWKYFFPYEEAPPLLVYIEDRDLWTFKYERTKPATTALFAMDLHFTGLDPLMNMSEYELRELVSQGRVLLSAHNRQVELCIKTCYREIALNIGGIVYYRVPFVNCPPNLTSDVGNKLAELHPFAMMYYDTEDYRSISLRSSALNPNHKDVSLLAKEFNGGGHKHAAGFKVKRVHWLSRE